MNRTGEMNPEKGLYGGRRKFLQLAAGMGLGLGLSNVLVEEVEGTELYNVEFKVLDENTRFDIGNRGKEIIETAYNLGYQYEKDHGG